MKLQGKKRWKNLHGKKKEKRGKHSVIYSRQEKKHSYPPIPGEGIRRSEYSTEKKRIKRENRSCRHYLDASNLSREDCQKRRDG